MVPSAYLLARSECCSRSSNTYGHWVDTRPPGGGFPPPPSPPPWLLQAFLLTICVTIIIGGAFYYAHVHKQPNFFVATGVASALAWGLSVVGALIWSSLGIVSSIYWNSWFNLFAAGFAALAVGYS